MKSQKGRKLPTEPPAREKPSDVEPDTVVQEPGDHGQLSESELDSAAGGFGSFATSARKSKSG